MRWGKEGEERRWGVLVGQVGEVVGRWWMVFLF